jgi:lipoprotein-anchoring transpeptidase ErfK/SrfK
MTEPQLSTTVGYRELYLTRPYLQGPDVLAVQRRLQELGFDPQVVDGSFGPITEEAVIAFQRSRRLESNGVVSDQTYRALGFSPSSPTPPSPGGPWGRPRDISVLIDTVARRITVSSGRTAVRTHPVAVGKPSTSTPPGDWRVITKVVNPDWNVLGTRWMGLSIPNGNYGIHGTNNPASIGHAVSNGCIRLHNHNVEELSRLHI